MLHQQGTPQSTLRTPAKHGGGGGRAGMRDSAAALAHTAGRARGIAVSPRSPRRPACAGGAGPPLLAGAGARETAPPLKSSPGDAPRRGGWGSGGHRRPLTDSDMGPGDTIDRSAILRPLPLSGASPRMPGPAALQPAGGPARIAAGVRRAAAPALQHGPRGRGRLPAAPTRRRSEEAPGREVEGGPGPPRPRLTGSGRAPGCRRPAAVGRLCRLTVGPVAA